MIKQLVLYAEFPSAGNKEVRNLIIEYYQSMILGNKSRFQELIHPQSHRFGFGNSKQLYSVRNMQVSDNLDKFSKKLEELDTLFIIDAINHIHVSDLQASVEVEWRMNWLPGKDEEGTGIHWTCFHLVKDKDTWQISSILDRGAEIDEQYSDYSITKNRLDHQHYKEEIEQFVTDFIEILEHSDNEAFDNVWHDNALRFNHGNAKELMVTNKQDIQKYTIQGLKNAREKIPGFFVKNSIKSIRHIEISDLTATAELEWEMAMPDSMGTHVSRFHLVRIHDTWQVMGLLDRGIEQLNQTIGITSM